MSFTTLLKITNDILQALDSGNVSLLALLDLSSAFDTIDYNILLKRLKDTYGINNVPLSWISSYLSDRTQVVTTKKHNSLPSTLNYGVPQGSVLGPILFLLYTKPINSITSSHNISSQSFADDTQIQDSCSIDKIHDSISKVENCVSDVKDWMTANKLKLNAEKTEVLLIHSKYKKLPNSCPTSLSIAGNEIAFSEEARNLGVFFTNTLDMDKHVTRICRSAYHELRKIASVRHLLTIEATKNLVCCYVFFKIRLL